MTMLQNLLLADFVVRRSQGIASKAAILVGSLSDHCQVPEVPTFVDIHRTFTLLLLDFHFY
jgi:hypothetical protein